VSRKNCKALLGNPRAIQGYSRPNHRKHTGKRELYTMSQPDLKTTKRYYRSFMEWAQVCAPMQYMSMGLRTASKEEILGLIREWAETITRKDP
jgi:hypothetical protein